MPSDDPQMTCPACGAPIYRSDQQCLSCGAKLDEGRLVGDSARAKADQPPPAPPAADRPSSAAQDVIAAAVRTEEEPEQDTSYEVSYDTGPGRWRPGALTAGRGFFDSLSRGWAFLRESVLMAFRDRDLFLPSVFAVLANIILLGGLALILHLTGQLEPLLEEEGISPLGWVILIVAAFVGYLVTYFFTAMTVHLVDVHLRGEDAQLGSAASAIRGNQRRGLRDMAADTVERGWLAITYLLLPIMILEDIPFMRAADRARALHRHNLLQIVVGELGLMLTARVISFTVTIIGIGAAVGMFFLAPVLLPLGIGIALLLFVLASAFTAYVRTAFYTCLYLWAVAMETVSEDVPAPAPLQPALQAGW